MSSATARLHISAPLSQPAPRLSLPFFHIPVGVCPFPSHALMQGLLCFWYSWWRGCCSPAPVTVPAPVPSHSHAGAPRPAHPFHGSRLCSTALCLVLGAPSFSPFPTTPLSPNITSEEKQGVV
ncbi:hypothetical protein DV515_00016441 [Chloebia gouldiae]|uniref:Uncharacterized protein n=1 Tax=Chloebia gouldiae TaxID=44316 RepID=A0A3L8RSW7_CHLGU|nr:hypothetical protein DV515_00016441 [Chloebia gouldiae]